MGDRALYNKIIRSLASAQFQASCRVDWERRPDGTFDHTKMWLATDLMRRGWRGDTYSALNVGVSHDDVAPANGGDMRKFQADSDARARRAAEVLFEAGLVVFSCVDPYTDVDGRWHLSRSGGQVCISHGTWGQNPDRGIR